MMSTSPCCGRSHSCRNKGRFADDLETSPHRHELRIVSPHRRCSRLSTNCSSISDSTRRSSSGFSRQHRSTAPSFPLCAPRRDRRLRRILLCLYGEILPACPLAQVGRSSSRRPCFRSPTIGVGLRIASVSDRAARSYAAATLAIISHSRDTLLRLYTAPLVGAVGGMRMVGRLFVSVVTPPHRSADEVPQTLHSSPWSHFFDSRSAPLRGNASSSPMKLASCS